MYAANHGAQVLNLSLGPNGSAAQQAAFYQGLAGAINYAASKGVYVVFAGGNSTQAFVGGTVITGFTNSALQHMMFMGSTNASEKLSYFSNTPGSGYFLSTTGQRYSYNSMWMMADGENIWGASNYYTKQYGYSYITQMSGTSMSAPQGAGAIGLLLDKWPILKTNGKAAQLLEATGTYLGGNGVNNTYGEGYLNLVRAFQPNGFVTVLPSSGVQIPISGASVLSGGALGTLSNVASGLTAYTTFDSYQRNFTMNLSGMVQAKASPASSVGASSAAQAFTTTAHLADGSTFTFTGAGSAAGIAGDGASVPAQWSSTLTLPSGTTVSTGNGMPASASFAGALWGGDAAAALQTSTLGASNALLDLAPGGAFAAYGTETGNGIRFAFAWSATPEVQPGLLGGNWGAADASAASAGASWTMMDGWKAGLTFGTLGEHNGLLGSAYSPTGPLNFGSQNRSMSFGASSAFDLGGKLSFMVDAAMARTGGSNLSGSIISSVSDLYARSFGAALTQGDALMAGDAVSLTARTPLRVFAGSADMTQASVDAQGLPLLSQQRVGLTPSGTEMDFAAGYKAPLGEDASWTASLEGRIDPNNVAGTYDITAMVGAKLRL
jgi:Subtilase family